MVVASSGTALALVMLFLAVKLAGVTIATMVVIGSSPLLTAIYPWIWHKEVQRRSWLLCSCIVVVGCRRGRSGGYADTAFPLEISLVVLSGGARLLLPFAAIQGFSLIAEPHLLTLAFALGGIAAALPYFLFNRGMRPIPASHAYLYSLTEPLTASMLGGCGCAPILS
ncbi:MAG: EamA family transporter [Sphaerochaeta sp.]|nr:EamA family transporter [Sphaerochaeta sp.]